VDAQTLTKEQLLQDYDYYFSQMEQIHPDPYTAFGGKEAFHQAVRNLGDNLAKRDSLTLDEMKFEGNVLLSTLHDGHSNMGWAEIPETMPDALNGQPIYTPKEIYVVTDEHTFSAAFHITYMMWRMGAKVVGVPSSQAPNTFMEVTPFNLPNSGLECCVSNSLQRCFPDNDPRAKVFTPDIQLSYDDYRKYNFSKDAELLYLIEKDSGAEWFYQNVR
jgi:hypothetical protein